MDLFVQSPEARLIANLHVIKNVGAHTLAGVALIPTIKIGKVEVRIWRYDRISHRALEDLLARKRICVRPHKYGTGSDSDRLEV